MTSMEAREVLAPVGPKSPTLAQLILGVHRSPLYDERFTADSTSGYGTFYIGHNPGMQSKPPNKREPKHPIKLCQSKDLSRMQCTIRIIFITIL